MKFISLYFLPVALLLTLSCRNRTCDYFQKSSSMDPTVPSNTLVIVDKQAYTKDAPARWDIIVFKYPNNPSSIYLSRIVGLPFETILLTNGYLVINGTYMSMPRSMDYVEYSAPSEALYGVNKQFTIPADSYFVLGDNSQNARDSRFWGALPKQYILGNAKVLPAEF